MHTVELLDEAIGLARSLGYEVRLEAVDGHAGSCVVAGRKLLFVDVAASPAERLDTVLDVLGEDAGVDGCEVSSTLQRLVQGMAERRRAA